MPELWTLENLPPEPTPAWDSPEPPGTCLRNLHQHTPELSGTLRNNQHTPELSGTFRNLPTPGHTGTLRNLPEPASGTCSCDPHQHTPELIWAEDPFSLRCWGKKSISKHAPRWALSIDVCVVLCWPIWRVFSKLMDLQIWDIIERWTTEVWNEPALSRDENDLNSRINESFWKIAPLEDCQWTRWLPRLFGNLSEHLWTLLFDCVKLASKGHSTSMSSVTCCQTNPLTSQNSIWTLKEPLSFHLSQVLIAIVTGCFSLGEYINQPTSRAVRFSGCAVCGRPRGFLGCLRQSKDRGSGDQRWWTKIWDDDHLWARVSYWAPVLLCSEVEIVVDFLKQRHEHK